MRLFGARRLSFSAINKRRPILVVGISLFLILLTWVAQENSAFEFVSKSESILSKNKESAERFTNQTRNEFPQFEFFKNLDIIGVSAFVDYRTQIVLKDPQVPPDIHLNLISNIDKDAMDKHFLCILKFGDLHFEVVETSVELNSDHHNKPWGSSFATCKLDRIPSNFEGKISLPTFVSLAKLSEESVIRNSILNLNDSSSPDVFNNLFSWIKITDYSQNALFENTNKIAVCVPPIWGDIYGRSIFEWLEFHHTIMQVSKFIFYDYAIGPGLRDALEKYSRRIEGPEIELIPWKIPNCKKMQTARLNSLDSSCKDENEMDWIHYTGQISSMYDCLFRASRSHRWVAFFDLDEYIALHNYNSPGLNLPMLLEKTKESYGNSSLYGIHFSNVHYSMDCPSPDSRRRLQFEKWLNHTGLSSSYFLATLASGRNLRPNNNWKKSKIIYDIAFIHDFSVHVPLKIRIGTAIKAFIPSHYDHEKLFFKLKENDGHIHHVRHKKTHCKDPLSTGSFGYSFFDDFSEPIGKLVFDRLKEFGYIERPE